VCLGYTVWLIQGTAVWPYVGMNLPSRFVPDILSGGDAALFQSVQELTGGRRAGHRRDYRPGHHQRDSVIGKYMPGVLLSWGINLMSGPGADYWWALGITISQRLLPAFISRSSSSKTETCDGKFQKPLPNSKQYKKSEYKNSCPAGGV